MTFAIDNLRRAAACALCLSMLLAMLPVEAVAQKRIIVINAEQPNLWTLEQAHYLLAQMHRRNLDLRAKRLEDLDPNEIAGLRFDVMRMLVEFGATFNQADLVSNRLLSENRTFNSERRQQLIDDRDGLRRQVRRLNAEIEDLEVEKAGTEDEDDVKRIDARIAAKTARRDSLNTEIEGLNTELGTLAAPSGTPAATTGGATFNPEKLPDSTFDEAFGKAAAKQIEKFNDSPKLNASLRLDNFIQMQYEIISKQLSLLRDELGPGERLVFLELPQTVNAAHHESKRKWAQSWWRIAGYTKRVPTGQKPRPVQHPAFNEALNQAPIKIGEDLDSIYQGQAIQVGVSATPTPLPCVLMTPGPPVRSTKAISTFDGPPPTPTPTPTPVTVKGTRGRPTPTPTPTPAPVPTANAHSLPVKASGEVTKVTVTLHSLRHPNPDDLDIMLVGPEGQNVLLMSDAGGSNAADGLTITFDDASAYPLPDTTTLAAHPAYRPGNYDATVDKFLKPAPAPLGGSSLSIFNGTNPNGTWSLFIADDDGPVEGSIGGGWSLTITTDCRRDVPPPQLELNYKDEFVSLDNTSQSGSILEGKLLSKPGTRTWLEDRRVRTVELIPRQGSLNVNDMNLKVTSGAFNFVLSTLFGFGSSLNIQRQREQFSQFVQQELYSSAFGKGAREFGWTFTPMPGMDRLMSGVRTTYAVVVVPEEATSLVLESNGCYFPRSYFPPTNFEHTKSDEWNIGSRTSRNCGGNSADGIRSKAFVVPIPKSRATAPGNDFWVNGVSFQPVGKGKRIVVSLSGENFSPQVGVLVNGVALPQSIGLAQPLFRDDSEAGRLTREDFREAEVKGEIERIDPNKIVFHFKMAPDFQGTPTITLIGPGRAVDINWLKNVSINGEPPGTALKDFKPAMIGHGPGPDSFRIDRVRVFRSVDGKSLTALVSGAGFLDAGKSSNVAQFIVNGTAWEGAVESATLMRINIQVPKDENIKVTLVSKKGETAESDSVPNPAFLSVSNVEVTYEAVDEGQSATLLVRIKGTGFKDGLRASVNGKALDVAVKSATEAVFTMPDPKAAAIVTIEDDTGQKAKVVVARTKK
ncbi:MAG TPA: proprotein convertase P-domain-containing protein [Pyrinomonadaceae bacterium]|nr:proprotein convertase P-domain-containing protein [Pyrinomonadaceae bacterium]